MPYCGRCDRSFGSESALDQHRENSAAHNYCRTCSRDFVSWDSLVQHWANSPRHDYCRGCDEHFDDEDDLQDHYEEDHYYCKPCNELFDDQSELDIHDAELHYYCIPCKRFFNTQNGLDNHLRSSIHQPLKYKCPGHKCGKRFVTVGAITQHLESGGCPSKANRATINYFVAKVDRQGIVTDPSRLIRGPDGSPSAPTVIQTWATSLAWNGRKFECYVCHSEFPKLNRLNQHLSSGTHDDKVYRCPTGYGGCNAHFSMLSALCQHVESEQCAVHRFKKDIDKLINYGLTTGIKAIMA